MEANIRELAHRAVFEMQLPSTRRVVEYVQQYVQADDKTIRNELKSMLTSYRIK
jgi:hypothetical protein